MASSTKLRSTTLSCRSLRSRSTCTRAGKSRLYLFFFFSSRRRHTRLQGDWSSDVCSSDLAAAGVVGRREVGGRRSRILDRQVLVVGGEGRSGGETEERGQAAGADRDGEIGRASCRERV